MHVAPNVFPGAVLDRFVLIPVGLRGQGRIGCCVVGVNGRALLCVGFDETL